MRKRDQALLAALTFVAGCEMALAAGLIRKLQKYAVKAAAAAIPAEEAPEEAPEDGDGRDAGTV